jgi:gamma-glutamylputrescine oxidase
MVEPASAPSHYEAAARPRAAAAALVGRRRVEICVVGGGLLGISAAFHLARRGHVVALVEARRLGSGASGRNGGQVIPGFSCSPAEMTAIAGPARAREIWRWTCAATAATRALALAHAPEAIAGDGVLAAAATTAETAALRADQRHVQDAFADGSQTWLDGAQAARAIGSPLYRAALRDPRGFSVDPLALLHALADRAIADGTVIHEDTPALAVQTGTPWRIATPDGEISADHVVLAAQTGTTTLWPARRDLTLQISTSMIATAPLPADIRAAILPGGEAIFDSSPMMAYWRVSPDGRVLFGAGATGRAEEPARASRRLVRRLTAIYPALDAIACAHTWSGTIDLTLDRLPRFGRGAARLWIGHGLGGHGVAAAIGGGAAIAAAIDGEDGDFEALAGLPQRRIPLAGAVTRFAVPAALAWLRMAARLGGLWR